MTKLPGVSATRDSGAWADHARLWASWPRRLTLRSGQPQKVQHHGSDDPLVVWKVDRLGRSLRERLDTAHTLQAQGIRLRSLTEAIDTETPTGRLMFNVLGPIAAYCLDLSRERPLEGGRRRKLGEEDLAVARAMLHDPTIPVAQVAKRMGVSRTTFYARFPQARAQSGRTPP